MYHFFGFRVVASDAERVPADASTWWGRLGDISRFEPTKSQRRRVTLKLREIFADGTKLTAIPTASATKSDLAKRSGAQT